jgi:hypothetical protein
MMLATPYRFTPDVIRQIIPEGCIGVYALGDVEEGRFAIKYVGRSDRSLRRRLLTHNLLYEFSYFIFMTVSSTREGFELESRWWHDCKLAHLPVENRIHPDAPSGQKLQCPYCDFAHNIRKFLREEIVAIEWLNVS